MSSDEEQPAVDQSALGIDGLPVQVNRAVHVDLETGKPLDKMSAGAVQAPPQDWADEAPAGAQQEDWEKENVSRAVLAALRGLSFK